MSSRRWMMASAGAFVLAILAAGCTPAAAPASTRPTDPHLIVTEAVKATAALATARLHIEVQATIDPTAFGGKGGPMTSSQAIDADVDLATRQLAGRSTASMTGFNGGMPGQQAIDLIVTNGGTFMRQSTDAKWMKAGDTGISVGPTNAAIAAALVALLDDERTTYEKQDAVECTLGTCDHVLVHLDAAAAGAAFAALAGVPADNASGPLPDFDVDVRVAQTSSVISELRLSTTVAGNTTQVLIALSNLNEPVQIVAPAPNLIDDTTGGFGGGFGPDPTTILETVGTEVPPAPGVEPSTAP